MQTRRRSAALLGSAWFACQLAAFGFRHDLSELPAAYLAAQVGLPLVLALGSLYVATRPGRFGLGTSFIGVALLALLGPLAFWATSAITPPAHPMPSDAQPWLRALVCSKVMLAWMTAPLVAAVLALRGAFAASAVWRSALVAASVGLVSGATLNLHCPNVHPFHMAVGHGLPIILVTMFGAFVLTRWVRA
jgi:hypothetical protein